MNELKDIEIYFPSKSITDWLSYRAIVSHLQTFIHFNSYKKYMIIRDYQESFQIKICISFCF